jgi:hypothetical protein
LGPILGLGSAAASIAAACDVGDGSQIRENLTTAGSATDGPEVDEGRP